MNKLMVYPPNDIMEEVSKRAKEDDRSLSHIAVNMMKESLSGASKLPEDIRADIEEFAKSDERTEEQMMILLLRQAIKEKKRLKEKYLKSLNKS